MSDTVLAPGVRTFRHLDVLIAYSGEEVGNTDPRFGEPEEVRASRDILLSALNPTMYVVQAPRGGGEFVDLSDIPEEELVDEYPTDGLFIDRPGVALGLSAADCIAMAVYGKGSSALGVIHAGRHGIEEGIHTSAIEHMTTRYGVALRDVRVFFGPSIHQDSYFYPDIPAEQLDDPRWEGLVDRRNGNYHIDLTGRASRDLEELGMDPMQVQTAGVDVGAEDSGYFSHARSKRNGEPKARNGFAAMISAD